MTRKNTRTLEGHSSYVMSLAVSADGELIVSGSGDRMVKLYRMATSYGRTGTGT